MAAVETCELCGREITGRELPRRVLGRVYCPQCDRKRVRALNRRDRGFILWFVTLAHVALALFLFATGVAEVLRWWGDRALHPEEGYVVQLLSAVFLFPVAAAFAWVSVELWRLEGRGRLAAILLDGLVAVLCLFLLLRGDEPALLGAVALFSAVYLSRSKTADRFW